MAESIVASAVVTAPGAGAAILTIAAPAAGKYSLEVSAGVSGSAVADLNNLRLRRGGVDLLAILPHGASGQREVTRIDEVDFNGSQNLTIEAIGAGGAGIEYGVQAELVRIG